MFGLYLVGQRFKMYRNSLSKCLIIIINLLYGTQIRYVRDIAESVIVLKEFYFIITFLYFMNLNEMNETFERERCDYYHYLFFFFFLDTINYYEIPIYHFLE